MRSSVERLEIIRCDWRRDVGVASCCRFLESLLVVDVACLVVVGEGVAGGGAPVSSCVSVLEYVLEAALAAPQTVLLLVGHRGRVCKRVEEGCVGQALSFYTPCLSKRLQILRILGNGPKIFNSLATACRQLDGQRGAWQAQVIPGAFKYLDLSHAFAREFKKYFALARLLP